MDRPLFYLYLFLETFIKDRNYRKTIGTPIINEVRSQALHNHQKDDITKFNKKELKKIMTEIKKITKIALLWYGVAGILFAFFYIVLTDLYRAISQWPYNDPVMFWSLGGTLLVLAIGYLMAFFRKEWEEIKFYFLVSMIWILYFIIMNIITIAVLNLPEMALMNQVMNIVLLTFNLVLGIICWMKERS